MLKILFTGATGIFGKYFCREASKELQIYGTYYHKKPNFHITNIKFFKLDVTQKEQCLKIIRTVNPDVIIHAAALSEIDFCDTHKKEAFKTNFIGTKNIVDVIKSLKIKFVFISTSNVFSGKQRFYAEISKRKPVNYYGYSKTISENYVRKFCDDYIILRLTTMYGWNYLESRRNIATNILEMNAVGKKIYMVNDRATNFVDVNSVVKVTIELIKRDIHNQIFHIGGKECVSYYDFAVQFQRIFLEKTSSIIPTDSYYSDITAARPKKLFLRTSKLEKLLNFKPTTIISGLKQMHEDIYK